MDCGEHAKGSFDRCGEGDEKAAGAEALQGGREGVHPRKQAAARDEDEGARGQVDGERQHEDEAQRACSR